MTFTESGTTLSLQSESSLKVIIISLQSLTEFTDVSSPYEPPVSPDLTIDTARLNSDHDANLLAQYAREHVKLSPAPPEGIIVPEASFATAPSRFNHAMHPKME